MTSSYFENLIPELATRAERATLGRLGFSNPALRAHLRDVFARQIGSPGSYLGEPVFEATFGWQPAEVSMHQLIGDLLSERTVAAMDRPPGGDDSGYRFPRDAFPYQHQLDAWRHLGAEQPRSVVVTSGTGSGKTECFMVPILDRLAREQEATQQKLVGVRALFLYPLNALIQSQQERLHAWTAGFEKDVRFCLYNGNTPEEVPQHRRNQATNQVIDREMLRASPPPILVTNATMLEYMLVRAQDAPILQASQGKLQWIVLDEAHTYVGSQAAELALLLRRVLHAFGVKASDVRFVATSATIGGDEAARDLQTFLAHLAGLPEDQVHVVSGKRKIPELEAGDDAFGAASLDQLCAVSPTAPAERYTALCANATAKRLRQLFVSESIRARQLRDIVEALGGSSTIAHTDQIKALRWLDLLTSAKSSEGLPFLPLRAHIFHNVLAGLWACADPACSCKKGTALAAEAWPFGMVFMEERQHCDCGSPVFELRSCSDCNTTYLWAARAIDRETSVCRLTHSSAEVEDEFLLDVETADDEASATQDKLIESPLLIANAHGNGHSRLLIDRKTLEIDPEDRSSALELQAYDAVCIDNDETPSLICPDCGGHDGDGHRFFRRAILGAPFLLGEIIPTLLEFCPDFDAIGVAPMALPRRGRRMITFTDSRQGAARIAVKLQQESERNAVRSMIYRRMLQAGRAAGGAEAEEIRNRINAIRRLAGDPAIIDALISSENDRLAALSTPQAVPWRDIVSWLATNESDVCDWAHDYYFRRDPQTFGGATGKEVLASILTMREFARRPKRLNSPETMGLVAVRYPKLDAVKSLPDNACGLTLQEWKDFLKIALDFWVRESTFIDLPDSWRVWGGNKLARKWLMSPKSSDPQSNRYKRWPQCNPKGSHPRLVRLLAYVLKLDPMEPRGRDLIDTLLREAWGALTNGSALLKGSSEGHFLEMEDIAFAPITKGWVCPVTRRVLDTTLRGVTPYLPRKDLSERHAKCRSIEIPLCDVALHDFASEDERLAAIRAWLNTEPGIQILRDEGLWSDLNDRVVEGSRYIRTAEHSAQQSGARLQEYERDFKSGRINLLSCSTTMEMGVDIGGISVVAMNNVPPHPANYLQRAGRAGRRAETRSVALTVCKNNPHDQGVLHNTLWAFQTRIAAPKVSLSSAIIVQRHVNSLLLSHFLKREIAGHGTPEKLDMAWWLLPQGNAPADRFHAWAACFNDLYETAVSGGLRGLIRHTCHEGLVTLSGLAKRAADMVLKHRGEWFAQYDVIQQQLAEFMGPGGNNAAFTALTMQSDRLSKEYLLRDLAAAGVLPGYSFPTDIASLDTLTYSEIVHQNAVQSRSRDDNAFRRRELPSRGIAVALREYAPGAEVVIDGLVYQSRGVTLNWHLPATAQAASEIQKLRRAWRCKRCGSSGTCVSAEKIATCPDCGAAISATDETLFDYLDPAGFAVDICSTPHNDVSEQSYVPVQRPWVDARGQWRPLSNPALGQVRASDSGTVFHYSAGASSTGYAICLHCGRAEPMPSDSKQLPDMFQDQKTGHYKEHRRLRGRDGGENAVCSGSYSHFAIKRDLRLGHESSTDVLEILLYGLDGKPLNDVSVAYSIAVAVRTAVAAMLGIEIDELGCESKPVQLYGDKSGQAIVIYDHGASGYSSSIVDRIDEILRVAYDSLHCAADCPNACQHCLLQFDTRYRLRDLNRYAALAFMGGTWLDSLGLPLEHRYFGDGSRAEWQRLPEAISLVASQAGARSVRLYLHGGSDDWDLPASPIRWHARRWADKPLELVATANALNGLPATEYAALASLLALDGVSLMATSSGPSIGLACAILAEVIFEDGCSVAWATADATVGVPNMQWGEKDSQLLITGRVSQRLAVCQPFALPPPVTPAHIARLDVTNELDGNVQGFGDRFVGSLWRLLGDDPVGSREITGVTYYDRYLKNPLAFALLLETIVAVKHRYSAQWDPASIRLITLATDPTKLPMRHPASVWDDWDTSNDLAEAIQSAFDYCGMDAQVLFASKHDLPHARTLVVSLSDGSALRITLDQGFSCWRVQRHLGGEQLRCSFPFAGSAVVQGEALAKLALGIQGPSHGTYALIDLWER
ncbi:DEAD/DEAH box helicase [Niveibacterium sp. SC-1]|uniref:DEAD/DEAH box helicase n=1 Tax=Niveibacterium sp. SC-1 TaxID=3135646 RepID=UPI00311E56B7